QGTGPRTAVLLSRGAARRDRHALATPLFRPLLTGFGIDAKDQAPYLVAIGIFIGFILPCSMSRFTRCLRRAARPTGLDHEAADEDADWSATPREADDGAPCSPASTRAASRDQPGSYARRGVARRAWVRIATRLDGDIPN